MPDERLKIMTLCLLMYAAVQWRVRQALQHSQQTYPDQKGKPNPRPKSPICQFRVRGTEWWEDATGALDYDGGVIGCCRKAEHVCRPTPKNCLKPGKTGMSRLLDIFACQESSEQDRFDASDAQAMRKLPPKARSEYLIAFTPRSGSSWLTSLLVDTRLAGRPEEWLNPNHLPDILKAHPCRDLTSYVRRIRRIMLSRKRRTFGIECSWFQWKLYLDANQQRVLPFAFDHHIYWTRRDLLGQAISLYKATET
ncbi:MAG: hypothetical protein RLZZ226_765, partial [Pseudomonadota bacterium]